MNLKVQPIRSRYDGRYRFTDRVPQPHQVSPFHPGLVGLAERDGTDGPDLTHLTVPWDEM